MTFRDYLQIKTVPLATGFKMRLMQMGHKLAAETHHTNLGYVSRSAHLASSENKVSPANIHVHAISTVRAFIVSCIDVVFYCYILVGDALNVSQITSVCDLNKCL